jgi:TolB-like protein/Tfp pilus assembly protein PilF
MGIGTAISISKQVCEGLSEAHKTGVIHRDLKPSNIMIDQEGNVRIMDFGIARSLKEKGITGAGVMIGTPEYMSPEQAEAKAVDHLSDIYSLGVILYEMVTGRVPFEGDTALSIAMKHKGEAPKDPKEYNAQIPDDLSNLILKCLEKDKDSRFQNAGEVRTGLENVEKGIPTTDREIPKRKAITSKEITVTFGIKKLFVPALIILSLVIIAVVVWQLLPQKEVIPSSPEKPSIGVLPFEDLSPQGGQEHLCIGLAESLINALSKVKNLRVPAPTSSISLKDKDLNLQEIGEMLDVKTILRGSIQTAEDKIRIITQLVDVADNSLIWSEQYDRDLDDLFSIQDEISVSIVNSLKISLLGEEKEMLLKRYTENIEAYNMYLRGRFFWTKRTEEGLNSALEYFNKAIEIDPDYALAYAGLADSFSMLPFYGGLLPEKAYLEARTAALKALELDKNLAKGHVSLGAVKSWYDWDWEGAEREYKLAIQLNPNYTTAHHWYYGVLIKMGRDEEALTELRRALELDPLSLIINTNLGDYFYESRQYDKAIAQYQKTTGLNPQFKPTHNGLGKSYLQKDMFEEAVKELQISHGGYLVYAYVAIGKRKKALEVLEELKEKARQQHSNPMVLARAYLGLGEIDKTFDFLNKAYQERWPQLVDSIFIDPYFDNLHSDPRLEALLNKIGLE